MKNCIKYGFTFLAFLFLGLAGVLAQQKDKTLPQGNEEYSKSQYAEAEADYRISNSKFPSRSVSPYNLGNAIYNINRKNADIKFFELGKVYHKFEKYEERKQLAILVSGRDKAENWLMPKSVTDFYMLKAYVKILLDKLKKVVQIFELLKK